MTLAMAFWLIMVAGAADPWAGSGVDDVTAAQAALKSRRFTWYDSARDDLRPVEIGDPGQAASADRATVRRQQPRPPAGGTTTSTPGGSLWGLNYISWLVIGLLIALLAAVLIWTFFRVQSLSAATRVREPTESTADRIRQLPLVLDSTPGDFRQLAEQAARQGDYKNAMIWLFSHVLLVLDEHRLIRLRRGKTNRQYLQEVSRHGAVAEYFRQIMLPFEAALFGNQDVDPHVFETCWRRLPEFERQLHHPLTVAAT